MNATHSAFVTNRFATALDPCLRLLLGNRHRGHHWLR